MRRIFFPDYFIYIFQAVNYFGMSQVFDTNVNIQKTGGKEGDGFNLMEKRT